jgi:hypothetical protein
VCVDICTYVCACVRGVGGVKHTCIYMCTYMIRVFVTHTHTHAYMYKDTYTHAYAEARAFPNPSTHTLFVSLSLFVSLCLSHTITHARFIQS